MKRAIAKLIAEISELVVSVNLNTHHHVMLDIDGNVDQIELRIYLGGWQKGERYDLKYSHYYWDKDINCPREKDILDKLSEIIDYLQRIIELEC